MNARNQFLFLGAVAAVGMSLTGCVCVIDTSRHPGSITMRWTFGGQQCATLPDITQVRITMSGQTLQNGGIYPCITNGTAGIVLLDFASGTYPYTIEAMDSSNTVLYSATGSVYVNGDVTETVDLQPVAGVRTTAYVSWTFPTSYLGQANPGCGTVAQVPIAYVYIYLDGSRTALVPASNCSDGFGASVALAGVTSGTHTIDLQATDSSNRVYLTKHSTLQVVLGGGAVNSYTFDWAVGGLAVAWSLSNGGASITCGAAGVTDMYVILTNQANPTDQPYGPNGALVQCSALGTVFSSLPPATYEVVIQGYGTATTLYRSTTTGSVRFFPVTAGTFPVLGASTTSLIVSH